MTFEKTYEFQEGNRLIINLPDRFKSKKKVRVIIEDIDEDRTEKINLLKNASS
jgi:predicted KAP-like P-loop ATPase